MALKDLLKTVSKKSAVQTDEISKETILEHLDDYRKSHLL